MAHRIRRTEAGLSLIELMVSITLGLIILVGLTFVFLNSNRSRSEIEKSGRQIENGSYAMQLLSQDLRHAGYLGELPAAPPLPGALPDPCATDLPALRSAMGLHVQGYDNAAGALSCLSDVKSGTDVLVVRRASTCSSDHPQEANCDAVTAGHTYLQVSGCTADALPAYPGVPQIRPYYLLESDTVNLSLRKIGCTSLAKILRYRTHIYFIANSNNSGDGIPTLKRWELGGGIVPLVEGIENLQLEYGLDTTGPSGADGIPDAYSAAPATVADWSNVTAVKIHVLARNTELTAGHTDSKTYALGLNADGSANLAGPYSDAFKRHTYAATVRLTNPAGRREGE